MRKVDIVADPRAQRCWLAVDVKSGETLQRLHDRGLLERVYRSLDWKVMQACAQRTRNETCPNEDAGIADRH